MLQQRPQTGSQVLIHAGDTVTFTLEGSRLDKGEAWLRSNLNGADIKRQELIEFTEIGTAPLDRDWFDIPMKRKSSGSFAITVPVCDPGVFQAKAFFLPDGATAPRWPEGGNVTIKVEPAARKSGNSIYSAFTRLFGPASDPVKSGKIPRSEIEALDNAEYTVIPRSGKFRDLIRELNTIVDQMGFRNLLLLPIHPTPTTYARMGRFGSPFAALDLMDVDPALAEFDRRTTPLDQFRELIDATHAHGASIFMDMPLNHTGWASALQIHHPAWFVRDRSRKFQSPGAWGVTWEDLAELNYKDRGLWQYMADVFLFWCRHGVDGFRCDAGYMIPPEVWQYITAKVRRQFPDTVFLLEGLGGKKTTTAKLLSNSNLNWAYSELFQNYDRGQIESYLPEADHVSTRTGLLVHFAETHDNNRLAAESPEYSRMRTALCALLSRQGAYGITCGVEWFASEKIVVHDRTDLNWGAKDNQLDYIRRINSLLNSHPAFSANSNMHILHSGTSNALAVSRICAEPEAAALILVNLDMHRASHIRWNAVPGLDPARAIDLLTDAAVDVAVQDNAHSITLEPGQVLCLASISNNSLPENQPQTAPEASMQIARAKAVEIVRCGTAEIEWTEAKPSALALELLDDPKAFFLKHSSRNLTIWRWPEDTSRIVPVPAGSHILVTAPHPFRVDLIAQNIVIERNISMQGRSGFFAVFTHSDGLTGKARLAMSVFENGEARSSKSDLLMLGTASSETQVSMTRTAREVRQLQSSALCTNGRGAISLVNGAWGEIRSQYDALLAGNMHPSAPSDRHVMLSRCRAWLVLRGYSQEINIDCLTSFTSHQPDNVEWVFSVPSGMGCRVCLRASLLMHRGEDSIALRFERVKDSHLDDLLDPDTAVKLILRFDLEDRSFHSKTKAFTGPEKAWPDMLDAREDGFFFHPASDRNLSVTSSTGKFHREHEWTYMVDHPADRERGLGGNTDLFSPGYFAISLKGGESSVVHARINGSHNDTEPEAVASKDMTQPLSAALTSALSQYVVARDESKTVIAGYPWFLDWGRDTLICLRGMISCGMLSESRDILCQFASFEDRGTIPNMIRGDDVSNRDTSDAPLWLHVAAQDLIDAEGSEFLKTPCGGRPLSDVLVSIAENYIAGTPNGIHVDPDSGLVFSPSHFTWMDTNHPAGTPREGYPVEIQALWFRCLALLASITGDSKWGVMKDKIRKSIADLYFSPTLGYLSDCLHCRPGTPAVRAVPDDHLRPNQLFAITLGALTDKDMGQSILEACQELLVPGAIRSLADRPVAFQLPVYRNGALLNDPSKPYWGHYSGDEDTRRKPAYHNGTAWTWPFPSYCEALLMVKGPNSAPAARSYLSGMQDLMQNHCIGQIPELLDGNSPHAEKGCTAQAWGISEFARVLALLERI